MLAACERLELMRPFPIRLYVAYTAFVVDGFCLEALGELPRAHHAYKEFLCVESAFASDRTDTDRKARQFAERRCVLLQGGQQSSQGTDPRRNA
eukprot:3224409-Prymnesium_polylepis.1